MKYDDTERGLESAIYRQEVVARVLVYQHRR